MVYTSIAAALMLVLLPMPAAAQSAKRNAQRERRIEDQLEAIAPAAVPVFQRATQAGDAGHSDEAMRLFEDVLRQAPDFSPAMRRLGFALVAAGREPDGIALIEQAVRRERSAENLISLAEVMAFPGQGKVASPEVRAQALKLAQEAADLFHKEAEAHYHADDDASYLALVGQLALSLRQHDAFRAAVASLTRLYPHEMATHYFAAIRAALDEDWAGAEVEIAEAERLGLPHEQATHFLQSGVHTRASVWRYVHYAEYLLGVWIAGLLLLFLAGKALSTSTLRMIDRTDPNEPATRSELARRRAYRALVGISGVYYYVSLPFVIALVIGGTGAVIYGFFTIGRPPIRLIFVLAVGALITVYKMVQSLFVRMESPDPGRSLEVSEARGLWQLAREVAEDVRTRPIDEIRVTPGTEMAVYERGSARDRNRDEAHRVLILGVGLLQGFRQGAFRGVLAHEYGHFSHRDTAGGDVALRVNQDMMKFAVAMVQHGQAVWWNLAFLFLRVYSVLFRRITHGATRLQEVLADRVAAETYGAAQFEEGLRHVIRRSIEFQFETNREIEGALQSRRAFQNVYDFRTEPSAALEQAIREAVVRPTTEDDTHPGPQDRIWMVSGLKAKREGDGSGLVWDLFADPVSLMAEMTDRIGARVRAVAGA